MSPFDESKRYVQLIPFQGYQLQCYEYQTHVFSNAEGCSVCGHLTKVLRQALDGI